MLSLARLHIVAIGAVGTLTFGWLFTGRYPWLLAALSGLDWFLVNLLNRVVDLPEDTANRIVGTDLARRRRRPILWAGLALLGGSVLFGHVLEPRVTLLRIGFHLLGLGYNWPLLPGRRRIKQLYFWKNAASATGFVLTVFAYPLSAARCWPFGPAGAAWPPGITAACVALALAFFVPFELSYEVIYDLRDVAGDAAAGLRTFPAVHGTRGAMIIVIGLLLGSLVPLVGGYALGAVPWRLAVMGAAPLLQLGATLLAARRAHAIDARFCVRLTWLGVALLVTYHLWFLAGLPGSGNRRVSINWVEPTAVLLVASFVLLRVRLSHRRLSLLARLGLLAVASWIAEESAIRAYGFYHYASCWRLVVGHVPLAIVLIWPAVIHSAWDTSRCLLGHGLEDHPDASAHQGPPLAHRGRSGLVPLVGAALVFADAWLIEPVSVRAGLWSWGEPGLFAVPPVGVLGWALHAGLCMAVLERSARAGWGTRGEAALIGLAPIALHALLLAAWWAALRWVSRDLPPWPAIGAAWLASLALTGWALHARARLRIPPAAMWARVPPTLLFLALLLQRGRDAPELWVWALAFAPPYLSLTRWLSLTRGLSLTRSGSLTRSAERRAARRGRLG